MALDLKKFIARFVGEARDHLAKLESGVARLDGAPDDIDNINALFRSAHTVKGSARMLKLMRIAETAHRMEDVLGALREGQLRPDPAIAGLLLRGVDAINARVDALEETGVDTGEPEQELCDALARLIAGERAAAKQPEPSPETGLTPSEAPSGAPSGGQATLPGPEKSPGSASVGASSVSPSKPQEVAAEARVDEPGSEPRLRTPDTVRVPLAKLDELIRLLGEMAASQARLRLRLGEVRELDRRAAALAASATAAARPDSEPNEVIAHALAVHRAARMLGDDVRVQEMLSTALNERALVLRMLPLSMIFDPALRMVRELARATGKDVRCQASGGEIELDRQIIDKLGDCLLHCLRNAVDHGIEPADERRAADKPASGSIRVSARHVGAGVVIELSDDGRGLNRSRIIAKAMQRGLIDAAKAAALSDEQVAELVFEPGLSTSEIITELSGRGVGMDVVKTTVVDQLHGAVTLSSRPGEGSTLVFKLPLSLAVMRVLLFDSGGQRFGFTAQHVVELLRVNVAQTIRVAERPAVVLRNEFVPLISLAELLRLPHADNADDGDAHRSLLVVVIGVRRAKLGVIVDRLHDERDMVIKALPAHLQGWHLTGGVVVTGDRALVCVLQAPSVMELARRAWGETAVSSVAARHKQGEHTEPRRILVVDDSLNTREIEKEVLEAYGYRVTTAEDGLDGWQKAVGGQFDAVLTDVEMPRMDGFSLTAKLRQHQAYATTPIVIITSRQREEDKRRGIEVGADAYLSKGDFDQSSLLDTLRDLLG